MFDSIKWFLFSYSSLGMVASLFCATTMMEVVLNAIGWLAIGLLQVTTPRWHAGLVALGLAPLSWSTWGLGVNLWEHSIFSPGVQWWILPLSLLNATLASRLNASKRPADLPHA